MQENPPEDDVKGYMGFHQKRVSRRKAFQTEEATDAQLLPATMEVYDGNGSVRCDVV